MKVMRKKYGKKDEDKPMKVVKKPRNRVRDHYMKNSPRCNSKRFQHYYVHVLFICVCIRVLLLFETMNQ